MPAVSWLSMPLAYPDSKGSGAAFTNARFLRTTGSSLVRPPGHEFLEADVAVTLRVGVLEIQLALCAGDVAVQHFEQRTELRRIDEAIAVDVAQIEDLARFRHLDLGQRCHDRSCISDRTG